MMDTLSLYGITQGLVSALESEDPGALELIGQLVPQLESKAAAVAGYAIYTEDLSATLKARAKAMQDEAKRLEAKSDRLKAYIKECMEQAEVLKIVDKRTGTTLAIQGNGGKLPLVIDDEAALRDLGYTRDVPPPLDNEAIRSALDEDVLPYGAHLGERGTHLVIK